MNHAWLIRPYPNNTYRLPEFRQNDLVAIGWGKIGDLTGKTREEIKTILAGDPYQLTGLALGNAYATIDIFVNRIHPGDLVLVPDGSDIFFGKICSDYYLANSSSGHEIEYPHQRKVRWLNNVARKDLSKQLRSSLKVQRTTADLSKHYDEISALAHGTDFELSSAVNTISVSYPLRRNFTVSFELPADITKEEAQRLAQHLETLYNIQ